MLVTRYLSVELSKSLGALILILLSIMAANQIIRLLGEIAASKLALSTFFQVILLYLPYLLHYILPLAFLLAIVSTYTRLYADNELVAFFSHGLSRVQFIRVNLVFILCIATIQAMLSWFVMPYTQKIRRNMLLTASSYASIFHRLMPKQMLEMPHQRGTVYIDGINNGKASHLFIAMNDRRSPLDGWHILASNTGENLSRSQNLYPQNRYYALHDGYLFYQNKPAYPSLSGYHVLMRFKTYAIKSQPSLIEEPQTRFLSTKALLKKRPSNQEANTELMWRLSQPLVIMLLGWVGCVISRISPRSSRYFPLLCGVLIYVLYMNALSISRSYMNRGLWYSMLATHLVACAVFAIIHCAKNNYFNQLFHSRKQI